MRRRWPTCDLSDGVISFTLNAQVLPSKPGGAVIPAGQVCIPLHLKLITEQTCPPLMACVQTVDLSQALTGRLSITPPPNPLPRCSPPSTHPSFSLFHLDIHCLGYTSKSSCSLMTDCPDVEIAAHEPSLDVTTTNSGARC